MFNNFTEFFLFIFIYGFMKVAGFFSGVGGIELGFQQAGFEVVWSNELDTKAAKTFKLNHSHTLVVKDILDVKSTDVPSVDVIVGGFPCQPFSIAGHRKGFDDKRGEIFFQLARIIKEKKPKAFLLENVRYLYTHDGGRAFREISKTLSSYGYHLIANIFDACQFSNVPQKRERLYIVGFKDKKALQNYRNLETVERTAIISDIVDFDAKVEDKYYLNSNNFKHFDVLERSELSQSSIYQWRRVYLREIKSKLCPTLTANMGSGGHNVPIVTTKHGIRKLTPHECFWFQGFPRNFKLPDDIAASHLYKQAGNSVAVPLITRIAERMREALLISDGCEVKSDNHIQNQASTCSGTLHPALF